MGIPLYLVLSHEVFDEDDAQASAKILIDAGCDPRAQNIARETPLHAAATNGFVTILGYLLAQDIPLPCDILFGSPRTIRFLLKRGVDVHSVATNYGDVAGLLGQKSFAPDEDRGVECARFLGSLGWDLSSKNSTGITAIHAAVRHGDIPTVKYLLSQYVPLPTDILLDAMPSGEYSWADSRVPLVQFLIHEGANVHITASNGNSFASRSQFQSQSYSWIFKIRS